MLEVRHLDLTLPTPAENLACDEALLDEAEELGGGGVLRFWEAAQYFVVLGYANHVQAEVNVEACRAQDIPVFRRCSGGGTVLQGPGCLNYALVLPIESGLPLETIAQTNRFIMERHRQAMSDLLGQPAQVQGHTDLTLGALKFSGNAQRRKRRALIFHGTFLLRFDVDRVEKFLALPARQPAYRASRPHRDFLINLELPAAALKQALQQAWGATGPQTEIPRAAIAQLVREKYSQPDWNWKW